MASKEDKIDIRNAKRSANRVAKKPAVKLNQLKKEAVKEGKSKVSIKYKYSDFKVSKTNSARQPSMPVKTGVKNKMKAQGAKSMSAPTSGYGKTTKKK